ncbi:protein of unknown function DUF554 [Desulfovibrio sp. X2]|uniref:DUF554 domain-containing protein n=1 Tax=Desulfovibrio sp. X2 TaxID=941449 RepID=UPI000358A8C5|nr:DUF554 domain-containing protein [Desulfovibrio sp. X2]EPR37363.1 protein of unknown function DUF554 [Desulfovibrio sp. X2]
MLVPIGSLVNAGAILAGGSVGLALGARLPARVRAIVFQGLGLCTLALGAKMALVFKAPLVVFFSILLGGVIGAAMNLEDFLASLGDRLKALIKSKNEKFTAGLISAFLLYCVGSMTILGAFDEGLRGDPTIYYTKSLLDGFASIALASTYGVGVLFAAVPVFLYQYGLTLFAAQFQDLLSPAIMNELTAVGGILIMGIGINLLELKYIKLGDLLPALVVVVVLGAMFL